MLSLYNIVLTYLQFSTPKSGGTQGPIQSEGVIEGIRRHKSRDFILIFVLSGVF